MVDAQRALLDELMGTARNLTDEEKKGHKELYWDDKEVCGYYLVRFCPHDLFVNTKSNLGPCRRIHDPKLKQSFEHSTRHDLYVPRFEAELAQFCEKLVQDLDRKIKRGRERLAQDVDISSLVPIPPERVEQLATIEEKIKKLLEQSESLGEEGKIDEAHALMKMVDALNAEKTSLMQQTSAERGLMLSQEKKMALCETCGSFLVANDALDRTQTHVTGKQHMGYSMVRDFIAEYKSKKDKAIAGGEKVMKESDVAADEKRRRDRDSELIKENGKEKERYDCEHENRRGKDRGRDQEYDRMQVVRERVGVDRHFDRDRGHGERGRARDRDRERERERERERYGERERERERGRGGTGGRDRGRLLYERVVGERLRGDTCSPPSRSPLRSHNSSRRRSRSRSHSP